jgi:4-amino-4-deoxy-L-arabinose transferase-like glycosyltransferase
MGEGGFGAGAMRQFSKKHAVAIALISIAYVLAAASLASRRAPWNDEGWFAEPAYTLLTKGYMGSPIIHPRGTWLAGELTGIQTHTYWIMPGSPVLQAVWYRIFGFGVLQMRAISISAGLLVIWAWTFVVWNVTGNRWAAILTAAILGSDVTFLYGASDGRMDMTTAACGSLGLAAFVWLRERNLTLALLGANALIAAAILCHPNGAIYSFLLVLFAIRFEIREVRWRHLLCLTPYFIFVAAWAIYILQQPAYFAAQFKANADLPTVNRMDGFRHPLNILVQEVTGRYLEHFGGFSVWAQLPGVMRAVPFLYWGFLIWLLAEGILKKNRCHTFLGICTAATFAFMGVFVALKSGNYLAPILPLYAASGALAVCPEPRRCARIPLAMLTVLLVAQGLGLSIVVRRDEYHAGYMPAVSYLQKHASRQTSINGSPGLRFALPTYRLISDSRLHEPAEFIVVDRWYRFDWEFVYRTYEPQTEVDVQRKLEMYEQVFDRSGWTIFRRRSLN